MDQPDIANDMQREAAIFGLKGEVSRALHLTPQEVTLHNADDYATGSSRFLKGFTESTDTQPAGFFKLARTEKEQLARESAGITIAHRLGIPTVNFLHPYQETPEGDGLLHVEQLDGEKGTILASKELIAGADPVLGARAAGAIGQHLGQELPGDIEPSLLNILKRGDWRNESPETFWKVWDEQNAIVFHSKHADVLARVVDTSELRTLVEQTRARLAPIIDAAQDPEKEYFVHNDTAPNNIFFADNPAQNAQDVLLLDFEHAAASHNPVLAKLTDLGNYYGRCWPNPQMQQEFLLTVLRDTPAEQREQTLALLRSVAVFGALYLAKYGIEPSHPEHDMAIGLLGSLKGNLARLDEAYQQVGLQGDAGTTPPNS